MDKAKRQETGAGSGGQKGKLDGSLSVEAALSLTLFLFTVILLSVPMQLLDTQRKIQMVLETTAREMSRQAWLPYRMVHGENVESGTESGAGTGWNAGQDTTSLFMQGAAALYLDSAIRKVVDSRQLESLDCSATRISEDGEQIDLRAVYRLKLPFSVFTLDSISLSSRSWKRGWIGRKGGSLSQSETETAKPEMVYIGQSSIRYHLSENCHYLSNQITPIAFETVGNYKNLSGSYYKACQICGDKAGSGREVYIFPNGEYYHSRADCSSLNFYIRQVPLTEVSYLGACSYCGNGL